MMDKKEELKAFGIHIQKIRKSKNLSQSQLAHRVNKDRESISRLERGGMNPTYIYLKEICIGLEIGLKELFDF